MLQKIIQVGNSLAVTIPSSFADQAGWEAGEKVVVTEDHKFEALKIQKEKKSLKSGITPEFYSWLNKFNAKYKTVLEELAKK